MKLSVVIPVWSGTPVLAKMALALCQQVRPMCNELIVAEDGDFSEDLWNIADFYLFHRQRLGHARNLWTGVQVASGDYIGILDSDIVITQGTLRDLCMPGRVVGGRWKEFPNITEVMGWCVVIDRTLLKDHPIGTPEFEGLGDWMQSLLAYNTWTNAMEYSHIQKRSYSEMNRLGGRTIGDLQTREISLDRHHQRVIEDPIYKERWGNET